MATNIEQPILEFLKQHPGSSSAAIYKALSKEASYATVKRALTKLLELKSISTEGQRKATTYRIALSYGLLQHVDMERYFEKEIDEREIKPGFQFDLLQTILPQVNLFTNTENTHLQRLHQQYLQNIQGQSPETLAKEMNRLAIDLSWKSAQIEGNTYSLLETELLLNEQKTAAGKPKDDATMLLNHKEAISFIQEHPDYMRPLSIRTIEDIHSILVKDLGVDRNIRTRRVGISGTNYRPADNEFQIREAMLDLCTLVNGKSNIFEKALLCLSLIAYIQPFNDGNKRTSRIVSNAILLAAGYCPLSFRTVDATDYKKAMLIFYEQNNISAFKKIFMEQYEFAVTTYF